MTATRFKVIAAGCAAATAVVGLTACAATGTGNGQNAALAAATNGAPSTVPDVPTATPTPAPALRLTTALRAATIPKMGKVVTDQKGWVLYRFDKDTANPSVSNCEGKCAQVWPPALTDGNPELLGVDPAVVGTVIRADGSFQLTLAGWPVYRYIGDPKPGAWKGQNVGGTWFVVSNNGKKNLTCLPTPAPTAVTPPAAPAEPDTTPTAATGDGGNGGY